MAVEQDLISGALQENLLTLLCYSPSYAPLVRATVEHKGVFESSIFRDIAGHAISFLDTFGTPICEHLADEMEPVLSAKGTKEEIRRSDLVADVLRKMHAAHEGINGEYVITQLQTFVRHQHLKGAVVEAIEAIEAGNVESAELALTKGLAKQVHSFKSGVLLNDPQQVLAAADSVGESIDLGIGPLDDTDCRPRRKELFIFMAPATRGKSWGLIHVGKRAVMQRKKVWHVTLEMSQEVTARRYLQSFFAVSRRDAAVRLPHMERGRDGLLSAITHEQVERPVIQDSREWLRERIERTLSKKPPIIVTEFPTGGLTLDMMRAHMDMMERHEKFVPDVIIIDYPDLMKLGKAETARTDISTLYKEIRGLGVERNAAMVVASQSNREGAKARIVDETMLSEDFSKMMTADTLVSYSQTPDEFALGLARLTSIKNRNDESKRIALITQSYAIGQFALDAVSMSADYWEQLPAMSTGAADERPTSPTRRSRDVDQPSRRRRLS